MIERDIAARRPVELLAALLDHAEPLWRPDELPPLAHWLLFPPRERQSQLGADGHPARKDDGLPRRMWAGSRVAFHAPVPLGVEVVRETSELRRVDKTGRSGRMQFVTLQHRISVGGRLAIEEEQDLVYREAARPGVSAAAPPPETPATRPSLVREVRAGPVQLFRFSALTYNSHRIHYDREFAASVEGYPGLVVHGPLMATLLMDLFLQRNAGADLANFAFRALRPVFDIDPFTLGLEPTASGADLVVIDRQGGAALQAAVVRR